MQFKQYPFIEIFARYDVKIRQLHHENHIKEDLKHVCDQIQIFYNIKGKHLVTLDDLKYYTEPRELVIIHPWHPHRIQCLEEDCVYGYIQFTPEMFDIFTNVPHLKTDLRYWINNAGKSHENHFILTESQARKLENYIYKYDDHSGFAVDFFRISTFIEILAHITICIKQHTEFKDARSANTTISERTIEYIDHNLSENIQLKDIAAHLYITEKYLCSVFKKQTGFTIKQYISHCRIQNAKRVLGDETKSPKDAFAKSGYNDYPTFLRMFKKLTGCTPTEFQETKKAQNSKFPKELQEKLSDKLPED